MTERSERQTLRFGQFELDVPGYELRRRGRAVRLERQPMDLLILLVTRRGELISWAEIIERLWKNDVFVDIDTGVNTAIRKIRRALNDSPAELSFIETVAGKGYRFIAEIARPVRDDPSLQMLAVVPFVNLTGDAEREHVADGLTDDTIAALGQLDPERLRHRLDRESGVDRVRAIDVVPARATRVPGYARAPVSESSGPHGGARASSRLPPFGRPA